LREQGYDLKTIPYVLQFNKRDLPTAMPVEEMKKALHFKQEPIFEAIANKGTGVFETLKMIAKMVLLELRKGK
jgi:signal recognition particle receptor subunit beta